jgi:hypothetical protein
LQSSRLFSVVTNNDTRATNNLTGVTFTIDFAETGHFTQFLGVRDFDEVDVVFGTESFDKFDVFFFGAGFDENAKVSLASN